MSISPAGPPGGVPHYPSGLTPTPPPQTVPGVLRSPLGLANAVTALLGLAMAIDLFVIAADINLYITAGTWSPDDLAAVSEAGPADVLVGLSALLQSIGLVATAVVFIIWFHRVRGNGEVFSPSGFDKGRGWAIGGWFVPIGNFFIPYRIARDTWTASTQRAPDGSWRPARTGIVTAWWFVWILGLIVDRVASQMYSGAEVPDAVQSAALDMAVATTLDLAAAVLAIVFVRRLTAMQHRMATEGPLAAV
ncbi:DUF4328 domain-containing protein [Streptomyces sp. NPDC046977]|uniref:DUF4328 domain-containing protein n=1 Tax=Streptomyces sp. NPDC046977 TaxID=3154703 RepID=UPI0033F57F58